MRSCNELTGKYNLTVSLSKLSSTLEFYLRNRIVPYVFVTESLHI